MIHDYFKNIDNIDKAYILGFIAADGCIIIDPKWYKNRVEISIHEQDSSVLYYIYDKLQLTNTISYKTKKGFNDCPSARLNIDNKNIVIDLQKLGITPRKSLTLRTPQLSKDLYIDFYRGLFDGDGGIVVTKNKLTIALCGSENIIKDFKFWCETYLSKTYPIIKPLDSSIYYYRICGRNALIILDILYSRGYGLPRKKELYLKYKKIYASKVNRYIGVYFNKRDKKYIVRPAMDGIKYNVGRYDNEIEAAQAYNKFILDNKLNRTLNIID